MPKEIIFEQKNPQVGKVKGKLRIINHLLFIKVNSLQYAQQLIKKFRDAGCSVDMGKGWIQINLFYTHNPIRLGNEELNYKEEKPGIIENKLYNFYMIQYAKSGMKVEGNEL